MAENGEEKLLAVARHIAKTLGHNDSTADDILQIFSNFDGRFSRENLSEKLSDDDSRGGCAALEHNLKSLERQISHYIAADNPIWADSADSSAFLEAIEELIATIRDWSPMANDKSVSACLVRAEDLIQQAMFRLEEEFRSLMERGGESFELSQSTRNPVSFDSEEDEEEENGGLIANDEDEEIPVAQPITGYDIVIDPLPSGTIKDLHEMAKRMVAAGFVKECSHVYSSCRREFLEESMSRLGLQELSIEEVYRMPWQDLEDEIERWIKAANVALRILFPSERRLCDRVFFGLSSAADLSFMEVCRGSTIRLLTFADAVAIGSRSPERLFKVLDLFETLRDLMPEFESLFSDNYCLILRNEAMKIWKRLAEAIRGIFMELENLIRRDPANAAVPGGGLHPISRYVMNYLRAAYRSRQTLEQIFEENVNAVERMASSTSLSLQMAWIMELLESNLEVKSKIYRDPALCSVFLMNNGRYIFQKVEGTELGSLLGDDWIRKHIAKIRQYHVNYQRSSWNKVLGVLKLDNTTSAPNVVAKSMKEKIKLFKLQFDEICKTQSTWVVFDEQLKKELRVSVAKMVLPAYRNFIGRFQNVPEVGKHEQKYVKYSAEDIDAQINDLFRGTSGSAGDRR
ncbi:exocyst complex component EXO70B1-like [Tripterygium wilfordii]|uniref:Exocyst subunit Exo70 family protein n=1 Tax=Tripterygium wilfordii TaxID=458696 RepID=A0A7J7C0K7_TRIWF|nr:exocyst complex component EXO70B1-like [Tripterygium wilfordii]KAF5727306.1 exocyst complex component EXO70B1-like [Tripterygium wilfordii]